MVWAKGLSELGLNPHALDSQSLRFSDLGSALINRYTAEERWTFLRIVKCCLKHLSGAFGGRRLADIADDEITAYAVRRRDQGKAAIATVNLELRVLRRGFRLLKKRLPVGPEIHELPGANKRKGTVPEEVREAITGKLKPWHAAVVSFLRLTGWRPSEPLRLEWRNVDWEAKSIRLDTTKNGKPRVRAFGEDVQLKALLEQAKTDHEARPFRSPWVFCKPDGSQITYDSLRGAWAWRGKGLGYKGGLHNFRRTRTREQVMQGIPDVVGAELVGIDTLSIYRDYASIGIQQQEEWLRRSQKTPPERIP